MPVNTLCFLADQWSAKSESCLLSLPSIIWSTVMSSASLFLVLMISVVFLLTAQWTGFVLSESNIDEPGKIRQETLSPIARVHLLFSSRVYSLPFAAQEDRSSSHVTCMHRWLDLAGIADDDARPYVQSLHRLQVDESNFKEVSPFPGVYNVIMSRRENDSRLFLDCIGKC